MLKGNFPRTKKDAEFYGGFLINQNQFGRIFNYSESLDKTIEAIILFLQSNGFDQIDILQFDENSNFQNNTVAVRHHSTSKSFLVVIERGDKVSDLEDITGLLTDFRDKRDWKQFHNSKDLSLAISIEAGELLELFLWKENEAFDKSKLKEELADILCYSLLLAEKNNLDIFEIIRKKIARNNEKYPVDKARGNARKYNEL